MTLGGFSNKYNLNVNFIDVHGLIKAVPREWRQNIISLTPFEEVNKYINLLKSIEKPTTYFYRILIENNSRITIKKSIQMEIILRKRGFRRRMGK
jgi:hypothetical protein